MPELEQAIVGGAPRHRHARRLHDVEPVGHDPRDDRRRGNPFRVRAPQHRAHDPLPGPAVLHVRPDLGDRPRALVPDHVRRRRHLAARAIERVAALDAYRLDVNHDVARPAHRGRHVLVAEHTRRTGLVVDGGLHPADATALVPAYETTWNSIRYTSVSSSMGPA